VARSSFRAPAAALHSWINPKTAKTPVLTIPPRSRGERTIVVEWSQLLAHLCVAATEQHLRTAALENVNRLQGRSATVDHQTARVQTRWSLNGQERPVAKIPPKQTLAPRIPHFRPCASGQSALAIGKERGTGAGNSRERGGIHCRRQGSLGVLSAHVTARSFATESGATSSAPSFLVRTGGLWMSWLSLSSVRISRQF